MQDVTSTATGVRCDGAHRASRRMWLVGWALAAQLGATPVAAQVDLTASPFMSMGGACGSRLCPPPSDPQRRNGFVMRLQTLMPDANNAIPGGGFGEEISAQRFAQHQMLAAQKAALDPKAALTLGVAAAHAGRYADALPQLQRALALASQQKDQQAEAASLANLGVVDAVQGRYDAARRRLDAALVIFRRQASEPSLPQGKEASSTMRLPPGMVLAPAQLEAMRAVGLEALRAQQALQARRGLFLVLMNQGSLAAHTGQYESAVRQFEQAAAEADPALEDGGKRAAHGELELLYRKTGRLDLAAVHGQRAQASPLAEKEEVERWRFFTAEVALGAGGATPTSAAPPQAAPVPAAAGPVEPALDPAAQQMKAALEQLIHAAGRTQMATLMPQMAACQADSCRPPEQPATRKVHVLRLAGVAANPMAVVAAAQAAQAGQRAGGPAQANASGVALAQQGRLDAASVEWTRALQSSAGGREPQTEAATLSNLGVAAAIQGRPDEARASLRAALKAYEGIADQARRERQPIGAMTSFANGAMAQMANLTLASTAADGRLLVALNLANLEAMLGRTPEAQRWIKVALDNALKEGHGSSVVYGDMAVIDRLSGRNTAAADHLRRLAAGSAPSDTWRQFEVGYLSMPAQAAPIGRIETPSAAGTSLTAKPPEPTLQALPSSTDDPVAQLSAVAEAMHARLATDATERERTGDVAGAMAAYSRAAVIAAAAGHSERERSALAGLQRLHAARGDRGTSIFHGKRAVNSVQRLRQSLAKLDPAARRAFLADRKNAYVLLAQSLLDRKRLPEAEEVLRILKEDEGQQSDLGLIRRGSVPYSARETLSLKGYDLLVDQVRPLDARRAKLVEGLFQHGPLDSRAVIEEARLAALNRDEERIATLSVNLEEHAGKTAECRRIHRQTRRSAAETGMLTECAQFTRALSQAVAQAADAILALKRESPLFGVRPSELELRQMDALLARTADLRTRLTPELALVREFPTLPPEQQATVSSVLGSGLTGARLRELWKLQVDIDALTSRAASLDVGLNENLGSPEFTPVALTQIQTGQRLMAALPAGTVALYYLQGDERLDVLAVGSGGWHHERIPAARAVVAQRIGALRDVVSSPSGDPVPAAKAMYTLLVAPIESWLKAQKAATLMLALEGPLRYVPFAALHDGRGWLAERYALSIYTTAAPTALTAAPARRWRAMAFGATKGTPGPNGLSALPGVKTELEMIVRLPGRATTGVLDGEIRLDDDFTATTLRDALRRRPNVLHIASHFVYDPKDAAASYLHLGDLGQLTLAQISRDDGFRFDQIDLVTLSACETALVAANGFGQEVEALGTLLQSRGAAAVLSTLWPVDDDGTALFMRRMYEAREEGPSGVSRAQAIRAAQLSFIKAAAPPSPMAAPRDARGASRPDDSGSRGQPLARFAHPFFWAPFVLMGNWL